MKSFLIVGLGRFGTSIATELSVLGHDVLAVDIDEDRVAQVADIVTQAIAGDARDPDVLRAVGAANFDCAVVTIGSDVGSSALVTLSLKELGVAHVVAKANGSVHGKVLTRIGADQVVIPEKEMAVRLAQHLANNDVINFIELSPDFSIVERKTPKSWEGKSLKELGVRANHRLNVIAIRHLHETEEYVDVAPGGDDLLEGRDTLVVLGRNEDIDRLDHL